MSTKVTEQRVINNARTLATACHITLPDEIHVDRIADLMLAASHVIRHTRARDITDTLREILRKLDCGSAADRLRGLEELPDDDICHVLSVIYHAIPAPAEPAFTPAQVTQSATHPAAPIMEKMRDTYLERRAEYGPSEQRFGALMLAAFPEGLTLRTKEDWVRYGLLHQIFSKLSRYTDKFHAPHLDTIHDIGPYAAMLEAEDRRALAQEPFTHPGDSQ